MMDDLEDNLNEVMASAFTQPMQSASNQQAVQLISKLKFRNTIYSQGDHIILRQALNCKATVYGRIIRIAQVKSLQFPVLLVAWYFTREDPLLSYFNLPRSHFSKKELILSSYQDWQYVQAVEGKIDVISAEEYEVLEPKERENDKLFFCRSYLLSRKGEENSVSDLRTTAMPVCHCLNLRNPDELLATCVLCGFRFHPGCSNSSYVCLACQ